MTQSRVLVLGLDGYENSLGEQMMAAGELQNLAAIKARSASMLLDHGPAQRTGLAFEHVATGLSPQDADRWAAVEFDPQTYQAWQQGTTMPPFPEQLDAQTVVFDAPYFDLRLAPNVSGIVNWGAHDPGVPTNANPDALLGEFVERFGEYPAKPFIYGVPWASPDVCRKMGKQLTAAVDLRTEGSLWLLKERLPDWQLAMVVVSEPHSAIEGLWHGVDPDHPLHGLPSARPAGEGLREVYRAVDRLVGRLAEAFPDAQLVVFSMGGMGANHSDIASMVLLPELLHRQAFGESRLQPRAEWLADPAKVPMLNDGEDWHRSVHQLFPAEGATTRQRLRGISHSLTPLIPPRLKERLRLLWSRIEGQHKFSDQAIKPALLNPRWMPLTRYQSYWPKMRAFALPSFYDGRVRINLKGREKHGMVEPSDYQAACDEVCDLLLACNDPRTGQSVVDFIEQPSLGRDPLKMGTSESDLVVVWKGPWALDHPSFGLVGPVPYRRPGGHTGRYGMAYIESADLPVGDHGVQDSFAIVPTIIEMLGEKRPKHISGESLLKPERPAAFAS